MPRAVPGTSTTPSSSSSFPFPFAPPPPLLPSPSTVPLTLLPATFTFRYSPSQRIDIEIVDGSSNGNTYLSKKSVKGETRLAVTTHENADVGVCFKNYLDYSESDRGLKHSRVALERLSR